MDSEKCPFAVGAVVFYRPSAKGRGAIVMTDLAKLVPGQKYKIAKVGPGFLLNDSRLPAARRQSLSPFRRVCYRRGLGGSQPVESLNYARGL